MAAPALMQARALIADDDPGTLVVVGSALERLGFDVTSACDGDELLQKLAAHGPFDLLVTDVSMPWMTGLQVAHSARAAGMVTPVIVMTALQLEAREIETLGTDALLLRKPFGFDQFAAAIDHLLGPRGSRERDPNRRARSW